MPHSLPLDLASIHQRLPGWLCQATPGQRALLKARLRQSHRAARQLASAMAAIPSVETFSRPLLRDALARWYPGVMLPAVDTAQVKVRTPDRLHTLSWLEAALQNFDAGTSVSLYASPDAPEPLNVDSTLFVSGVRNLDLGQRYQHTLGDVVDNDHFRGLLREQDRAAFAAELTIARLQGRIDSRGEALGEAALDGASEIPAPGGGVRALNCGYLSLLGFALAGPLLVRLEPDGQTEPCLLYLPGDPQGAVRQYRSLQAVGLVLTKRLWMPAFRQFFNRYVSHAEQPAFAARLRDTLYPRYPYAQLHPEPPVLKKGETFSWIKRLFPDPHDLWQQTLDQNARLPLTLTPWSAECFAARARAQVQRTLTDAASLAVPVAQLDAAARQARLLGWLGVGLSVLNAVSLFVPALGELMLAVGGAQIVDEFLEGVHALDEGEADAAIAHLFEVFDNLLQFAVLGAAHGAFEAPGPLQGWTSIPGQSGRRLWHGDLTPFTREAPWPPAASAATDGLHDWQGEPWLALEGKALPLEPVQGKGRWQLAAAKGQQHSPTLLGNDDVPWRLEHEQPLAWRTPTLTRRLGACTADVSDDTLLRALRCTGYSEAAVRRIMVDQRRAPALLLDSLQALEATAPAAAVPASVDALVLGRDFPSLSPRARAEILAQADANTLSQLRGTGRLPLPLAETARLYLREARLNRALQRFHQQQGPVEDRDRLAFANLERLPGWTDTLRLELREQRIDGPLIAAAGPEGRPLKTLLRSAHGYEPLDETGQALASPVDLWQALLNALPDEARTALDLQIHEPLALRDALFEKAASDRRRCALQLGMAPVRPMFRLPTRLIDDARIGYRLSGRGRGWVTEDELFDSLFPAGDADDRALLRQRLRQEAGTRAGAFGRLLERLRDELRRLDATLDGWIQDSTGVSVDDASQRRGARVEAAHAIRQAWRRQGPPEDFGNPDFVALTLDARHLGPLPQLPDPLVHVRRLTVNGWQSTGPHNLGGFLPAFPRVQHLDIAANLLRFIPEEVAGFAELQSLDLSENFLQLDDERNLGLLTRLTGLQRLNLTDAVDVLPVVTLQRMSQLPSLASLQLDLNSLSLEAEHFEALRDWPALTRLSLGSNDITLNVESRAALGSLDRLEVLFLEENPLQLAPDVTGWRSLRELDLASTEIRQWPAGLQALLEQEPLVLERLDLSGNRLTEAPALRGSAFARAINPQGDEVIYDFNANPWSETAQANLADAGFAVVPDFEPDAAWYEDLPLDLEAHRTLTADDPQWAPLYDLFARLRESPDYQNNPGLMHARLARVLRALTMSADEQADGVWGQAELHQQVLDDINDAAQGCVDQASLLFQSIETEVTMWWTVSTAEAGAADEAVALGAAAGLLRQGRLDERVGQLYSARVARRRALAEAPDEAARQAAPPLHPDDDLSDEILTEPNHLVDEIEMALYARIQLQARLNLPVQPQELLFGGLGRLSVETLQRLEHAVLSEVDGALLAGWASEQRFWQAWVRRLRPAAFEAFAGQWSAASEYYTEMSEAGAAGGAYTGPAVPERYVRALEQQMGNVPGLVWRVEGVLQRIDLVSDRYVGESGLFDQAGRLLVAMRREAEQALYRALTEEIVAARFEGVAS
ncbi:MAG TPA: DUF6543 domain-containing protein [Pseudomonas sp.]|uniref:dermonecrotic toxin domain-containing protein n=1 Tax=Pseudomonas sp. TaxID=306 RepID=UPI002B45F2B3|nr:DUF6543 domain-containing protein [Pseudomonas sp.]HKS12132.1 DUF6543 domain-containing protein [Pseudomonas sp.]